MTRPFSFARIPIMAFAIRDLSVLAYANGFTLWHYKAGNESLSAAASDDYFADAGDMMAIGDMLLLSAAEGCRALWVARADAGSVMTASLCGPSAAS
jgi:hypothetical protein